MELCQSIGAGDWPNIYWLKEFPAIENAGTIGSKNLRIRRCQTVQFGDAIHINNMSSAPSTPINRQGHCEHSPASVSRSAREQMLSGSFANPMPASFSNAQRAFSDRLDLDFPACLRAKLMAQHPDSLTAPDLFELFNLANSKKFKDYIRLGSTEAREKLIAFQGAVMDTIQKGDYGTPPKNFMAGVGNRVEQWNYLSPTIMVKYITQCDDPRLHQDKHRAAIEMCKNNFFSMACAVLDAGKRELEKLDVYEIKLRDVIFLRAKRLKRTAEQALDTKEKLKKIRLFEEALCETLEVYELTQPTSLGITSVPYCDQCPPEHPEPGFRNHFIPRSEAKKEEAAAGEE